MNFRNLILALAALSTESVTEILAECAEKNIPVIGFDSGVPGDTTGAVKATAATNNEAAAASVAFWELRKRG